MKNLLLLFCFMLTSFEHISAQDLMLKNGAETRVFTKGSLLRIAYHETNESGKITKSEVRGYLTSGQGDSIVLAVRTATEQAPSNDYTTSSHTASTDKKGFRMALDKKLVSHVQKEKDLRNYRAFTGSMIMIVTPITTLSLKGDPDLKEDPGWGVSLAGAGIMIGTGLIIAKPIRVKKSPILGRHKKGKWTIV
jgi:hypothetical protein